MTQLTDEELKRFWKRVDKSGPCWMWQGATQQRGYGVIMLRGKPRAAHRVSYAIHNDGFDVISACDISSACAKPVYILHSCDTPGCVHPAHLRLGTLLENLEEMVGKDRHTRGERHAAAKLTEAKVRDIRQCDGAKETLEAKAAEHSVSYSSAYAAFHRSTWRHIV